MNLWPPETDASRPVEAICHSESVHIRLQDRRQLSAPLWWYPRLASADATSLALIELSPMGLHWPALDEDISVESILRGHKAPGALPPTNTQTGS